MTNLEWMFKFIDGVSGYTLFTFAHIGEGLDDVAVYLVKSSSIVRFLVYHR